MSLVVRVPATTANLGPGFDVLGMALGLWNEIHVEPASSLQITVYGEGEKTLPRDERNLVYQAMRALAAEVGKPLPPVSLTMHNRIPLQSGLGSSAAAVVGGLLAASALLGISPGQEVLLRLAVKLEGHPDNVAPALLGGLVAVAMIEKTPLAMRVPLPPEMHVVVVLPDARVATEEARRALPTHVSFSDAVFNLSRAVLTVLALSRGDYQTLARVMVDRLHEPYRHSYIPGYTAAVAAGQEAGAVAVVISGSGPALAAFAPNDHERIADAMVAALAQAGVSARRWVLPVVEGANVTFPAR